MPDQLESSGLGSTSGVAHRSVSAAEARFASRHWWDLDADSYVAEHGEDLGDVDLLWCPEGLRESEVQLLGPTSSLVGSRVLEIGCGTAPVARWLHGQGAAVAAIDLSAVMLGHARRANTKTRLFPALIQADAVALPFADASFEFVVSAFGAIPFVSAPAQIMLEAARVLRPGGRFVFSVNHPMRWIFPDDPSVQSLSVATSYFDPNAYVEIDDTGRPTYVETHRTMSQRIRDITSAGLQLVALIEPEWVAGRDVIWGQWSRERAAMIPGTAIFSCLRL